MVFRYTHVHEFILHLPLSIKQFLSVFAVDGVNATLHLSLADIFPNGNGEVAVFSLHLTEFLNREILFGDNVTIRSLKFVQCFTLFTASVSSIYSLLRQRFKVRYKGIGFRTCLVIDTLQLFLQTLGVLHCFCNLVYKVCKQ